MERAVVVLHLKDRDAGPTVKKIWRFGKESVEEYTVAVTNEDDAIVGRVPKELSTRLFKFLMNGGSVVCTITGKRRNRGRGLEVPCDYKCTGSSLAVKKLRALD